MTNKPTYKLLSGADAIGKAIDSIKSRGKKLDRDIQIAALSAMQHHVEHGVVTLINRLIDAMPSGARVNALREYIETFGGVRYDADTKKMVHMRGKAFQLDDAMKIMWCDFKPEQAYKPIDDPLALIASLIKRFEKDMEKAGTQSKITVQQMQQLKAMQTVMKPEFEPNH